MEKGVIFDLDGVLVNTAHYHYLAWKELADILEIPFNEDVNESLKGVSRVESLEIILSNSKKVFNDEEKMSFLNYKNDLYISSINKIGPTEILPGVLKILVLLKEAGIKIALGSASKNASLILEKIGISDFFDAIVDGNSVKESKPHPEVFELGALLLNLSPKQCTVIEDADAGCVAAKRAGMIAVGIGQKKYLPNADEVVISMEELYNSLQKENEIRKYLFGKF